MRVSTLRSRGVRDRVICFGFALAIAAPGSAQVSVGGQAAAQAQASDQGAAAEASTSAPAQAEPKAAADAQPGAPEQPEAQAAPDDAVAWDLTHRAYNTFEGSTGGLHIVDPGMGVPGSVRIQLALDQYSGDNFLYETDEVEQNRQFLSVSWTALDALELFASIQNRSTVADVPAPNTLHALGDLSFGFKLNAEPSPLWRIGGGARITLLNDVGEQETLLDATNIGLTGAVALDLQRQQEPFPLILRFNVDYLFDNSAKVLDDVEAVRYRNLDDPAVPENEVRHLITRVERFGLGINRVDMFTLGLGAEVPVQVGDTSLFLHPLLEWRLGIPVNRQGYDCAFFSSDEDRGTDQLGADDTCVDDAGFDAYPMELTAGVRVVPPVRGLSAALAADFGLNGTDTFVRELAPTPPFRLMLVLAYAYDARPTPAPPAPPPPPPPPAPTGRLLGRVVDQSSNAPIADVVVKFVDSTLAPVASDVDGRFVSYELEPGNVELELSHPDYQSRRCGATVPESGGEISVLCSLEALPTTGTLKATLRDVYGAAVSGVRVHLVGPSTQTAASDIAGELTIENLPPGDYTARTDSDAYLTRVLQFSVQPRQQTRLDIALVPRPADSGAELRGGEIRTRGLSFAPGTTELTPQSAMAVAEVADFLLRQPSLRKVRIQGDGGELALSRALTIKQRLVDAGVPEARLEAVPEPARDVTLTLAD